MALGFASGGCNFTKLAANQTVQVFAQAAPSFDKEHDVALAREAGLGNLKLFEGLLEVVPENDTLLVLASRSFATYTFGFVEDELDRLDPLDDSYAPVLLRAIDFYGRSRRYALRAMELEREGFGKSMAAPVDELGRALKDLEEEDALPLFWIAYAWGSSINMQLEDPAAIVELPKVQAMMRRVVELDEGIFNGGAHLFLGAASAAVPPALGGDPEMSKKHFERAIALTGGRYLMAKALYARYYLALARPDREEYVRVLTEVVETPADVWPEQRLANELARVRAARWLERTDDIF